MLKAPISSETPSNRSMLKLLSEFLRSPGNFFRDERRKRVLIISLFSLLVVCILFSMVRGATRRQNLGVDQDVSSTPLTPPPTQTKWWVRHEPSETPTRVMLSGQTPTGGTATLTSTSNCPEYATYFEPGTFGYISLFPPYENLVRSGAGKNYSSVGFIEIGGWVKILAEPVCANDGYVWLNVESAAGLSHWTAGGQRTAQWVIPCPDPNRKCSKNKPTQSVSATTNPKNRDDSSNPKACVSDTLAVGIDAQVSPNDLLIVRSAPLTGSVIGHIAPLDLINIIDGPRCADGAVWWKVLGAQTGWAVENSLRACPKEGPCDPWKDVPSLQ